MEVKIVNFLLSLPKDKRMWGELFLLVAMRVLNPRGNQDMKLTRIVTESPEGSKKILFKLEITEESNERNF